LTPDSQKIERSHETILDQSSGEIIRRAKLEPVLINYHVGKNKYEKIPDDDDINILNTPILRGRYCSGCFKEAYRLLNFMKTNMIKDLKYITNQSFLIGESPQEPDSHLNIILYGDCAIKSTLNRAFRKILLQNDKNIIDTLKTKLKKEKPKETKIKPRGKKNKSILELSGCPPNLYDCLKSYIKYYGKEIVPSAYIYDKIFSESYLPKKSNNLTKREVPIQ